MTVLFNRLFQFVFQGILALSAYGNNYPNQESGSAVNLDELLTYECARHMATFVDSIKRVGPVFSEGLLVFTSIEAQNRSRVLIVNAGSGIYAVPLSHIGINRIRFDLPTLDSTGTKSFFLSYLHDGSGHSRYFEFSMLRPPQGRDELDYSFMQPQRAQYMLPNLEYAIYETSENAVAAATDKKLDTNKIYVTRPNCEHISRKSPALARNIKRNLDMLNILTSRPAFVNRMPANIGSIKSIKTPAQMNLGRRSDGL